MELAKQLVELAKVLTDATADVAADIAADVAGRTELERTELV